MPAFPAEFAGLMVATGIGLLVGIEREVEGLSVYSILVEAHVR